MAEIKAERMAAIFIIICSVFYGILNLIEIV